MGIKCVTPQARGAMVLSKRKTRRKCDTLFNSQYMQHVLCDLRMQLSLLIMAAIDETTNLQSHKRNLIMNLEESSLWEEQSVAECERLDGATGP